MHSTSSDFLKMEMKRQSSIFGSNVQSQIKWIRIQIPIPIQIRYNKIIPANPTDLHHIHTTHRTLIPTPLNNLKCAEMLIFFNFPTPHSTQSTILINGQTIKIEYLMKRFLQFFYSHFKATEKTWFIINLLVWLDGIKERKYLFFFVTIPISLTLSLHKICSM